LEGFEGFGFTLIDGGEFGLDIFPGRHGVTSCVLGVFRA
jgi:hypothetical protein